MVRGPFYDRNGIKRGAWSSEEDDKLRAYVERYGHWNWRELPKFAGLSRCGKSCRLRWINYLQPNVKRGNYSTEEETLIIKLHEEHGNKWSLIAAQLPGRTDNEVKNHWHTHLKKRSNISDHNNNPTDSQTPKDHSPESSQCDQTSHNNNESDQSSPSTSTITPLNFVLESSNLSSLMDTNVSIDRNHSSSPLEARDIEYKYSAAESDFWTKPFVYDRTYFSVDEGILSPSCSFYDNGMDYYFSQ